MRVEVLRTFCFPSFPARALAVAAVMQLTECGFVHDETLVARYKLVAVDDDTQMMLCWSLDSGSCECLIGETVLKAGFDDKYVVVARHQNGTKNAIIEYFYVVRHPSTDDKEDGERFVQVLGPFDQQHFDSEKVRLRLPEFTRTFDDL